MKIKSDTEKGRTEMDKNNQIEKMAKCCTYYHNGKCCTDVTNICDCDLMCEMFGVFSNLEKAGYRKASDVAREIFAEIEKIIEVDKFGEAKFDIRELYKIEQKYESEGGEK